MATQGSLAVIVTGGRRFGRIPDIVIPFSMLPALRARADAERELLYATLDKIDIACLAQGGARGADELARDWARARGIWLVTYSANWNRYGKAAGPIRNQRMLDDFEPDLVVAFPGGKGTRHMVDIVRDAGVRLMVIPPLAA